MPGGPGRQRRSLTSQADLGTGLTDTGDSGWREPLREARPEPAGIKDDWDERRADEESYEEIAERPLPSLAA